VPKGPESVEGVGGVDFDEREVGTVDRVASAGAAGAQAHADVHVRARGEAADESRGAGRAVRRDEQPPHVAIAEGEADLEQPRAGRRAGKHSQVTIERLRVGREPRLCGGGHGTGSIRTVRMPPGRG
jgi:hypothetical protein